MTLIDTGPLVALVDRDDPAHAACVDVARVQPASPLVTTWPCFTEAMYLLGKVIGFRGQSELWAFRTTGWLEILDLKPSDVDRMIQLMEKYKDTPMDLADASIVAVADRLGQKRVFTLDSDFRVYRLSDGSAFEIIP